VAKNVRLGLAPIAPRIEVMNDHGSTRLERWAAPVSGMVAVVAGLGAGSLAAGLLSESSPLTSLATSVIDNAPRSVERWAIDTFGTNDKNVLAVCVVAVLLGCGAYVGHRARVRPLVAAVGATVLAIVGCLIASAGRGGSVRALIPVLVAAGLGWLTLKLLLRTIDPFAPSQVGTSGSSPGRSSARLDRRRFIGLGGVSAAGGLLLHKAGTSIGAAGLDDSQRVKAAAEAATPTGSGAVSTIPVSPAGVDFNIEGVAKWRVPNDDFYRIDTAFVVPRVNADNWKLTIGGLVTQERTYTYKDLVQRATLGRDITLMCVSNEVGGDLVGNAYFQGVPLKDLLEECGIQPGAEQVFSTSVDGWNCGFPLEAAIDGRDAMVAVAMNGEPLPYLHGFPARLVIPGIYGYVSATKWLDRIDVLRWADAEGYWIPRGWSKLAPVKTASRIDVPRSRSTVAAGKVAVAGVAWAQHRGIAKVEVRISNGPWVEAELAADGGNDAWRQWKYVWDAAASGSGSHTIAVRATDKNGALQPLGPAPVAPDGAEGFHTIRVKVDG
jgi:DMSO/TMAO reductase YedYZ molybdopterin-dependent catalytic subunit